jgi:glycine/D-amino acid oxidase-like deaminating enzyme
MEAGEALGETFYIEAGVLWIGHRDDGFEAASEATLRAAGVPVERLTPEEVTARWPQISADGFELAIFEPASGFLMARRAVAALARAVVAEGGSFELADVRPGATSGGRLLDVVGADGRRHAADQFVFAAGPWLPRLFPEVLGDLIRVTKQDVVYFGPPPGDPRWTADALPVWVDYDAAFYGVPAVEGRGIKISPDRYGPVFDPSAGERLVDPDSIQVARRFLGHRFPALAGAPVAETRVCQYETTPDEQFVIDRHPAWENVWLVGGGSGHGFKHGPMIGATVAGRLRGELAEPWHDRFRIDRARESHVGMRTGGDSMANAWDGL